jgi:hypothetical protein
MTCSGVGFASEARAERVHRARPLLAGAALLLVQAATGCGSALPIDDGSVRAESLPNQPSQSGAAGGAPSGSSPATVTVAPGRAPAATTSTEGPSPPRLAVPPVTVVEPVLGGVRPPLSSRDAGGLPALSPDSSDAQRDGGIPSERCGPGEWPLSPSECWALLGPAGPWDTARAICQEHGSGWDLASILSEAEQQSVQVGLTEDAWLGATDGALADEWRWLDRDQVFWRGAGAETGGAAAGGVFTAWFQDEPNGGQSSACARVQPALGAQWADLQCDRALVALCRGPAGNSGQ